MAKILEKILKKPSFLFVPVEQKNVAGGGGAGASVMMGTAVAGTNNKGTWLIDGREGGREPKTNTNK